MGRSAREKGGDEATLRLLDDLPNEGARIVVEGLRRAFANVTRSEGTSWGESVAIDGGGEETARFALASHRDATWEDTANDPDWPCCGGLGGWNFLDPIGRRYYLPAGLARIVRDPEDDTVGFAFLQYMFERDAKEGGEFTLLTPEQRAAVARAIRHLAEYEEADWKHACPFPKEPPPPSPWRAIYERAWRADDPGRGA